MDNGFRVEDVLAVVREIASHNEPFIEYGGDCRDYAICDYCDGRSVPVGNSEQEARKKFKHELNCVWLIAKDMLTGYKP